MVLAVLLSEGAGGIGAVEEASSVPSSLTSVLPGMVLKPKGLFTTMRWSSTYNRGRSTWVARASRS